MYSKHGISTWMFGIGLLLAVGCDDGDDGSGDDELGDGDGDTTGDGDDDPTGDGDPTGEEEGPIGESDFGEGGQLEGCAVHETEAACTGEAGCSAVFGKPLVDNGNGGWCTMTTEEYIGCASSSDLCPALSKTLCDGDSYWRTTACVPDSLDVCENPGEISGDC